MPDIQQKVIHVSQSVMFSLGTFDEELHFTL